MGRFDSSFFSGIPLPGLANPVSRDSRQGQLSVDRRQGHFEHVYGKRIKGILACVRRSISSASAAVETGGFALHFRLDFVTDKCSYQAENGSGMKPLSSATL
jgi:hypothetical protein